MCTHTLTHAHTQCHLFQGAQVPLDILGVPGQVHDGVPHNLAGAVVRDFAAPLHTVYGEGLVAPVGRNVQGVAHALQLLRLDGEKDVGKLGA